MTESEALRAEAVTHLHKIQDEVKKRTVEFDMSILKVAIHIDSHPENETTIVMIDIFESGDVKE